MRKFCASSICIMAFFQAQWANTASSHGVANRNAEFIKLLSKEFDLEVFERRVKSGKKTHIFREHTNKAKNLIIFFNKKANIPTPAELKSIYIYAKDSRLLKKILHRFISRVTGLSEEKRKKWHKNIKELEFTGQIQEYTEHAVIPQLRCITIKIQRATQKIYYTELHIID